jgi:hypothetical protein
MPDPVAESDCVFVTRCKSCDRLHLVGESKGRRVFELMADAKDWVEMFIEDHEFAAAVAARLGRR